MPSLRPEIAVVCILLDLSTQPRENAKGLLVIERYHPSDQGQLQNFPVVSRDHLHYLGSLEFEDCGTPEPRKCVRGYKVLFGYYNRDLNFSLCPKERLNE